MEQPVYFGIRHLSPAGAFHLRQLLCESEPDLVLIEGPSDFDCLMDDLVRSETKPPVAVMAFTRETPIRTILYPFAEYSPEYQAIVWAREHGKECRFIDLPSEVFLGIQRADEVRAAGRAGADPEGEQGENGGFGTSTEEVYRLLDRFSGEDDHETFWEHVMEHSRHPETYRAGAELFGRELREMTAGKDRDFPEILVREAYMRRKIREAVQEGFAPARILVVTGAYHVAGLSSDAPAMTDEEIRKLPAEKANVTLMPYSYYRLSSHSGYGAGNQAPAYYEMLWEALCGGDGEMAVYRYLTALAAYQRTHGFPVSSAEVIEAASLAKSLAALHGYRVPALRDLKDAAVTAMGHGRYAELSLAIADTGIGTAVGYLPRGVSRTSLQDDFYRQMQRLKLEKYRSEAAVTLTLDLREKLNVKSEEAACRELYQSFFLHRLRVLGVNFGVMQDVKQENATWAENWQVRWTPEVEMELVESSLKGDTVAQAASFAMKERAGNAERIGEAADIIGEACCCGMPGMVSYATEVLQGLAVEAAGLTEIAAAARRISVVVRFGSIRRLDSRPLLPVLEQMFLRGCLLFLSACSCDDSAAGGVMEAMEQMNSLCLYHEFLDEERWVRLLLEAAARDDLNTRISGFAAAILLERGRMDDEELSREVRRRLSRGIPAELGAGWFEGLSGRNRYGLIARLSLWRELSDYLDTLDEEEFKRALVFLRRAFADFGSAERLSVAENLGEIWQVNTAQAGEILNGPLKAVEKEIIDSLGDFDFDDI